jgi:hypothetical protein
LGENPFFLSLYFEKIRVYIIINQRTRVNQTSLPNYNDKVWPSGCCAEIKNENVILISLALMKVL